MLNIATIKLAKYAITCLLGIAFAGGACAGTTTIDFENQSLGTRIDNFITNGFLFSPSCHYDVNATYNGGNTSSPSGNWIGFDISGCYDGSLSGYNRNYLGPHPGNQTGLLYVSSADGNPFSLESLVFIEFGDSGYTLYSSNGGIAFLGPVSLTEYDFSGQDWSNIDWLVFSNVAGEPMGFDNLKLAFVPEPESLALLGVGLVCFMATRRRRQY